MWTFQTIHFCVGGDDGCCCGTVVGAIFPPKTATKRKWVIDNVDLWYGMTLIFTCDIFNYFVVSVVMMWECMFFACYGYGLFWLFHNASVLILLWLFVAIHDFKCHAFFPLLSLSCLHTCCFFLLLHCFIVFKWVNICNGNNNM